MITGFFGLIFVVLVGSSDVENPMMTISASSASPIVIPENRVGVFDGEVHPSAHELVYILTELGFIDPEQGELEQVNAIVFQDRSFAIMTVGVLLSILIIGLIVKFGID